MHNCQIHTRTTEGPGAAAGAAGAGTAGARAAGAGPAAEAFFARFLWPFPISAATKQDKANNGGLNGIPHLI
jgi:hypothetical protein